MANPALRRLNKIQKKLYDSMVPEAKSLASGINRDIYLYSKKFEASLPKIVKNTTFATLKEGIKSTQLVLFGDFHTHKQSQKEFRRVIERIHDPHSQKSIIALECFRQVDQEWINQYLQNKINVEGLITKTKFEKFWGFPPENYLEILNFAKEHGIQVYGINSKGAGRDSLLKRDEEMARDLSALCQDNPEYRIFCLVGEFHLADSSLPYYLENFGQSNLLRIVMNVDQYYFNSKPEKLPHETQFLRLGKRFFCIMNSAPWLKWQSYMMWQEARPLNTKAQSREADHDLEYDIDSHFYTLCRVLNEYLSLNLRDHQLTDFHIYYGLDPAADSLPMQIQGQKPDPAGIRRRLDDHHHVWLPNSKSLLITKIDINTLAEAAGRSLYGLARAEVSDKDNLPSFYDELMETSFATICSKIINPQRKYADMGLIMKNLLKGENKWKERIDPIDRSIKKYLQWILKKYQEDALNYQRPLRSIYQTDALLHGKISHRIGQYWGAFLYKSLIDGQINLETLLALFFPPDGKSLSPREINQNFLSILFAKSEATNNKELLKIS